MRSRGKLFRLWSRIFSSLKSVVSLHMMGNQRGEEEDSQREDGYASRRGKVD